VVVAKIGVYYKVIINCTEEKSSTPTVWNVVGAERKSRHNVTENITATNTT
jgi:hypothetical protein